MFYLALSDNNIKSGFNFIIEFKMKNRLVYTPTQYTKEISVKAHYFLVDINLNF